MTGHGSHPWQGILKSMGLVFGDIGTSPIYTLTVIFLLIEPTAQNVMGILSLLIWTLIVLIMVEYAWLAMSLSRKGEGGTIVLRELLTPYIRSGTAAAIVSAMTIIGVALLIASVPLAVILIYRAGQNRMARSFRPTDLSAFLATCRDLYREASKIRGTALFFARDIRMIPPYVALTMFTNNIIYEDNIIISIIIPDNPFGVKSGFKGSLAPGLRAFEIEIGYMEVADIKEILQSAGIREKAIFYGLEEIVTDNIVWRIYAAIKRLTPSFVQFYKLPADRIHGVLTRTEL